MKSLLSVTRFFTRKAIEKPLVVVLGAALLVAGCGQSGGPIEITEVRDASTADTAPQKPASAAERFGFRPTAPSVEPPGQTYAWDTPEGWEELPSTSMRIANFRVAGNTKAECSFIELGRGGNDLAANVNRWRAQMGLPALSESEADALPKKKLLGREAVFISIEGDYKGMGQVAQKDFGMAGLIMLDESQAYFVKMTGPSEIVQAELANFDTFCASLRKQEDPHAGMDAMMAAHAGVADMGGGSASELHWHAPEEWQQTPPKFSREVTYLIGEVECYITLLGGPAGGVDANINRWRGQMGQPPLTPAELAGLPRLTLLGQEAPFVQISGDYTGMSGLTKPGRRMLGVVCPLETQTLFVKMIGPEDEVAGQVDNFQAFCESLHQ